LQARRPEVLRSPRVLQDGCPDLLQAGCSHVLQARRSEVLRPASDLLLEEEVVQLQRSVQAVQEESLWLQQLLRPEADLLQASRSQLLCPEADLLQASRSQLLRSA
jgi:hypothetical protein